MGSPALVAGQSRQILQMLNALANDTFIQSDVPAGQGLITNGSTTQAAGAAGALTFQLSSSIINSCRVNSVGLDFAAVADQAITNAVDFTAVTGKSVIFAVVVKADGSLDALAGAVADDGEEVAPSEAALDADQGGSNYFRLADVTVQRTGATAVTVTVANNIRKMRSAFNGLALTEAAFRA